MRTSSLMAESQLTFTSGKDSHCSFSWMLQIPSFSMRMHKFFMKDSRWLHTSCIQTKFSQCYSVQLNEEILCICLEESDSKRNSLNRLNHNLCQGHIGTICHARCLSLPCNVFADIINELSAFSCDRNPVASHAKEEPGKRWL